MVGIRETPPPSHFPTAIHQALEEALSRPLRTAKGIGEASDWVEVHAFLSQKEAKNYAARVNTFWHAILDYPSFVHPDWLAKLKGRRIGTKIVQTGKVWRVYLRVLTNRRNAWLDARVW